MQYENRVATSRWRCSDNWRKFDMPCRQVRHLHPISMHKANKCFISVSLQFSKAAVLHDHVACVKHRRLSHLRGHPHCWLCLQLTAAYFDTALLLHTTAHRCCAVLSQQGPATQPPEGSAEDRKAHWLSASCVTSGGRSDSLSNRLQSLADGTPRPNHDATASETAPHSPKTHTAS